MIATIVKYSFLQNSLIVGMILGILLPLIGLIVLLRKMPNIADALGHINMSAIAFAYLVNTLIATTMFENILITVCWTILGAILIEYFRTKYQHNKEVAIMIVYSISIALTMIFMNFSSGFQSSLFSILFGNINTISNTEMYISLIIGICVLLIFKLNYKKMIILSFDEELSKIYNVNSVIQRYLIMVLLALVITIAIKILGILLVSALLLIPLLSAVRIATTLKKALILAIVFTEISIVFGIIIGYVLNVSTSAIIVIISVLIYIYSLLINKN